MAKTTGDIAKSRQRPEQTGAPVMVRLQPDQLAALDAWRRGQPDLPSRPEAIRRLAAQALAGGGANNPEAGFVALATALWQHMGDGLDEADRAHIDAILAERPVPFETAEQGREWLDARLVTELEAAGPKRRLSQR